MDTIITFADGTIIYAENNGNCYITDTRPAFPDNLSDVIVQISNGDTSRGQIYQHAEIIECANVDGRYWFAFRELTPDELYRGQLDENIDTLLDMSAEQEYQICLMELGIN